MPPEELWQAEKWFLELSVAGANDEGGQHSRNFLPPASRVVDDSSRKGPAPKGAYWPV